MHDQSWARAFWALRCPEFGKNSSASIDGSSVLTSGDASPASPRWTSRFAVACTKS